MTLSGSPLMLSSALPKVFNKSVTRRLSASDFSQKLDTWLYAFFLEKFGPIPSSNNKPSNKRQARPNKALARLRERKKACKKARKALQKAGLAGSEEDLLITKQWLSLIREHNRLRVFLKRRKHKKACAAAERKFKANPHKFASDLFSGPRNTNAPTFSKDEAVKFFANTYRDENRNHQYNPLPDMPRPDVPKILFSLRCPTRKELRKSVLKKSNGAAPGLNCLTYVPYKKCPILIDMLHRICIKIWNTKEVPEDWAIAYIVLLAKSDILDKPGEFRPIAITPTAGKIFFSVISDRLQKFMVRNTYIPREVQKGFLTGMAGCLEHSFTLFEALRDAKLNKRQIVVCWIDLANAYGSVRHNLIQFALNWFHVPPLIQQLVFNYYEKLMAFITTKEWQTGFFLFDIGLFQGCVLSTILFDCVFQLLLNFLKPIEDKGYTFKHIDITSLSKAYADDLAIISNNSHGNQLACDRTNFWLKWTITMAAKPRKCVSMAMKLFDKRIKNEQFQPFSEGREFGYLPFDPKLTIDSQPIRFMVDPKDPSFKGSHFKFVGRWIHISLTNKFVRERTLSTLQEDITLIENCQINGLMKLWLYQFYVLAHVSWPFLVQDFPLSVAISMQSSISVQLKRWAGLFRNADIGALFRPRDKLGLGLTSISAHFKRMQSIKCSLLSHSLDACVRKVYENRNEREALETGRLWRPTTTNALAESQVSLSLRFPKQVGRQGLGSNNFNPDPSPADHRKLVVTQITEEISNEHVVHAHDLALQGVWLGWHDSTLPFDLSWKNLIYGPGPHVISFVLNATINCVHTPDMLKLWGYTNEAFCRLCQHKQCTLHHILSNCKVSLRSKRFSWRHDSISYNIEPVLQKLLASANSKRKHERSIPKISASFVPQTEVVVGRRT